MRLALTTEHEVYPQMITPLFEPLRLWTPRTQRCVAGRCGQAGQLREKGDIKILPHLFTMKGGFFNTSNGVRRLVIAGKITKNLAGN